MTRSYKRLALLTLLAAAASAEIFGPRISFTRIRPADTNLGSAVVIQVLEFSGFHAALASAELASSAEQEGFLSIRLPARFPASASSPFDVKSRPKISSADLLARAHVGDCTRKTGSSKRGSDQNNTAAQAEYWVDARCRVEVEIFDPAGASVTAFELSGSATSRHEAAVTADMEREAEDNALRRAGALAGARISPRKVTESIRLDKDAPRFDEAYRFIRGGDDAKAREIWNAVLRVEDRSAPLHYDLAAVCEALGDAATARSHYEAAIRLDPYERKYGESIEALDRRSREAATLHVRVVPLPAVSPRPSAARAGRHKKHS